MTLYKLLLEGETSGEFIDPLEFKKGKVAFPFKGKTDDYEFDFKKGDEVYYQHGTECRLDGKDYILLSLTQIVCQK